MTDIYRTLIMPNVTNTQSVGVRQAFDSVPTNLFSVLALSYNGEGGSGPFMIAFGIPDGTPSSSIVSYLLELRTAIQTYAGFTPNTFITSGPGDYVITPADL